MLNYVTVFDARGRFLWVSNTDPDLRIEPTALVGRNIFEFTSDAYTSDLRDAFSHALLSNESKTITGQSDINGVRKFYRTTFHPISEQGQAAVIAHSVERPTIPLTDRERQVAALIASDMSTRQIAGRLDISISTVDSHRQAISLKLGGCGIAGITRHCIKYGIVLA